MVEAEPLETVDALKAELEALKREMEAETDPELKQAIEEDVSEVIASITELTGQ